MRSYFEQPSPPSQDKRWKIVEAVIRAYDPCLSCSTHAAGRMPLEISLVAPDGVVLDRVKRC